MNTSDSVTGLAGLWELINSPLMLLIIGFILTTILGQIVANMLKKSSLEREIELKTLARNEEVRLVRLHEDRAETIKLLHDKLIDVERNLFNLLYNWRPVGLVPEFVKPEDVIHEVREYRKEVERSKIYFDEKLGSVIDDACRKLESTMSELENSIIISGYSIGDEQVQGMPPEFADKAWEDVHIHLDEAREELRDNFRDLLGVR